MKEKLKEFCFPPFKKSKAISIIFLIISLLVLVYYAILAICEGVRFTSEQLQQLSNFSLNVEFVIGALGLSFLGFPIKSNKKVVENSVAFFSYAGNVFFVASFTLFGYIVSYFPPSVFKPDPIIITILFIGNLMALVYSVLEAIKLFMVYYNVF